MKVSLEKVDALWILIPLLGLSLWMAVPRRTPAPGSIPQGQQHAARRPVSRDELLPIEPTFFSLSAATGGDFYFWSPGEFAVSGGTLSVPLGGEAVLLSYGELGPEPRRFEFPVDLVTERLEFFVGAQRLDDVRVARPSRIDCAQDPAARWQRFDRMRIAEIEQPESGEWSIELAGRGTYALTVHAAGSGRSLGRDPIECIDFDFVELGGRPGHEGLFPLDRTVRPGEQALLEVVLSGSFRDAEIHLVGIDGHELGEGPLELAPDADSGDHERVYVNAHVPDRPFRVLVRGTDVGGARYQRLFSNSVDPNAPELDLGLEEEGLGMGPSEK